MLVTDDADGFKAVADEVGVHHQVCKAHVLRTSEAITLRYQPLVAKDADGSLQATEQPHRFFLPDLSVPIIERSLKEIKR